MSPAGIAELRSRGTRGPAQGRRGKTEGNKVVCHKANPPAAMLWLQISGRRLTTTCGHGMHVGSRSTMGTETLGQQ